jgi:hypothetical protein
MPGMYQVVETAMTGWSAVTPADGSFELTLGVAGDQTASFVNQFDIEYTTAWAANGNEPGQLPYNIDGKGNWATYVEFAEKTVDIYAGQNVKVGEATLSIEGDQVGITINLLYGHTFEPGSVVSIQGYEFAPSGNPAPGSFDYHFNAEDGFMYLVDLDNFYGIHMLVSK